MFQTPVPLSYDCRHEEVAVEIRRGSEERKQMGLKVVLFLIVFMGLMIAVKKRVWSNVH